ncbi:MAG: uL30 family ribosomal protein [Nanoarchaeota archaeon]
MNKIQLITQKRTKEKKEIKTIVKDRNFSPKKFAAFPNKSTTKRGNTNVVDYSQGQLFAVIRIHGMVEVKTPIAESLDRLRLRRKYACVLLNSQNKNLFGMLKKVHYYVAYGAIDREMLVKLIKGRAKSLEGNNKKINTDAEEVADGLLSGKKLSDYGLKQFFRLHPPRKGINSKQAYPVGVLGNHGAKINELLERML